ncbi:hypothetical protein L596_030591 [Steinernema carpocapsae]|uniref:Uncharacterized protein n=1 Tax=Steinernema carpocapsae TaxID=34508 RepID=A0A4U5LPU0_STECR|nr:hypothetical protein L596_030591 [Steinernema carpocapsae]
MLEPWTHAFSSQIGFSYELLTRDGVREGQERILSSPAVNRFPVALHRRQTVAAAKFRTPNTPDALARHQVLPRAKRRIEPSFQGSISHFCVTTNAPRDQIAGRKIRNSDVKEARFVRGAFEKRRESCNG